MSAVLHDVAWTKIFSYLTYADLLKIERVNSTFQKLIYLSRGKSIDFTGISCSATVFHEASLAFSPTFETPLTILDTNVLILILKKRAKFATITGIKFGVLPGSQSLFVSVKLIHAIKILCPSIHSIEFSGKSLHGQRWEKILYEDHALDLLRSIKTLIRLDLYIPHAETVHVVHEKLGVAFKNFVMCKLSSEPMEAKKLVLKRMPALRFSVLPFWLARLPNLNHLSLCATQFAKRDDIALVQREKMQVLKLDLTDFKKAATLTQSLRSRRGDLRAPKIQTNLLVTVFQQIVYMCPMLEELTIKSNYKMDLSNLCGLRSLRLLNLTLPNCDASTLNTAIMPNTWPDLQHLTIAVADLPIWLSAAFLEPLSKLHKLQSLVIEASTINVAKSLSIFAILRANPDLHTLHLICTSRTLSNCYMFTSGEIRLLKNLAPNLRNLACNLGSYASDMLAQSKVCCVEFRVVVPNTYWDALSGLLIKRDRLMDISLLHAFELTTDMFDECWFSNVEEKLDECPKACKVTALKLLSTQKQSAKFISDKVREQLQAHDICLLG